MKYPLSDSAEKMFSGSETVYAENWLQESMQWMQRGVYRKIASAIPLMQGGIHVDFGSGLGHLLSELQKRKEGTYLLGIEKNPIMATSSLDMLQQLGSHATLLGMPEDYIQVEEIQDDKKSVVHRDFHYDRNLAEQYEILSDVTLISIIMDDVRNGSVVREALAGKPITSSSLTFPGNGVHVAYEAPYTFENHPTEKVHLYTEQAAFAQRYSSIKLATELSQTGSPLVLVERVSKANGLDYEKIIHENLAAWGAVMGDLREFWKVGTVSATAEDDLQFDSPIDWKNIESNVDTKTEGRGKGVTITTLLRNDKKWKEK